MKCNDTDEDYYNNDYFYDCFIKLNIDQNKTIELKASLITDITETHDENKGINGNEVNEVVNKENKVNENVGINGGNSRKSIKQKNKKRKTKKTRKNKKTYKSKK